MKRERGFTLIELMIVVSVVAVIALFALSSYREQIRKSRRSEAVQYLAEVSLLQEKFRSNNALYGTCTELFVTAGACTTAQGRSPYYTLNYTALSPPTGIAYRLTAAPKGAQSGDRCGTYTFEMSSGNLSKTASGGATGCL